MDMKRKLREFFTLKRHANDGFTLVELIVVIAIVAILGGVAVPAYSGYIEKADAAADAQILADVNKAFAAACMVEGIDNYKAGASASLTGDEGNKTIDTITVKVDNVTTDEFNTTFDSFFDNKGAFKKTASLVYDVKIGGFKDPATADELTVSYGGGTITVSGEVLQALQESTFGSVMGGELLLQEITGLTNMISDGGSNMASALLQDDKYMASFAKYLGYTGDPNDKNAVQAYIMAQQKENGGSLTNEELSAAMVNGMVFYAAEGMKGYTVDSAYEFLQSDNIYSNLSTTDDATRLAQASLVYGMYAGFVNSEYNTGDPANGVAKADSSTSNPMGAIQNISGNNPVHSANFQDYLKSPQGKADVKAYMESMNVINNAAGDGAGAGVLVNGFSDSELETLLIQVLGK